MEGGGADWAVNPLIWYQEISSIIHTVVLDASGQEEGPGAVGMSIWVNWY